MKYPGYEPELECAQGYCGSHHKWPRNWYQHLRPLCHHTMGILNMFGVNCNSKGVCWLSELLVLTAIPSPHPQPGSLHWHYYTLTLSAITGCGWRWRLWCHAGHHCLYTSILSPACALLAHLPGMVANIAATTVLSVHLVMALVYDAFRYLLHCNFWLCCRHVGVYNSLVESEHCCTEGDNPSTIIWPR